MILLKKLNKICILFLLLLVSCDESTPPTISNGISAYYESEMYLYGWYNNKYQSNLHWADGYACNHYNISIPELNYYEATGPDIQTYHYRNDVNYNPGYYFTVHVDCTEENWLDEYSDSIIVNTKEIDPIENIVVHVASDGYSDSLTFTHSSDSDIYKWYFYNFLFDQNNSSTHPTHNEQSEWQQDIYPFGWEPELPGYGGTNKLDYYKYTKTNAGASWEK